MSIKSRYLYTLLLFILPFNSSGNPVVGIPPLIKDTLDQFIQRSMKDWNIPGLALCIVQDGKVLVMKGYGVTEVGKPAQVDENTLFMIGSNTKAFTATALALLEYQHKCSLEDKVQKWLPEFTQTDPWVASEATLKDLLCHRLGYETFQGDFMYWDSDLSPSEVLDKFGKLTPMYSFRSRFGYTNAAFEAAGLCIEKISGKPWDDYISENILHPLNMDRTLLKMADFSKAKNIAYPHSLVNGALHEVPFCHIDNLAPAGSISSSVNDLSHWIEVLLDNGKFNDQQLIPFPVLLRTRMPQSIIGRNLGSARTTYKLYGMGWFLQDYNGKELISHTGAVDGFLSSMMLIPDEKLGIAILTNTDNNEFFETLNWEIVDAFLGVPYENYNGEILNEYREKESEINSRIKAWQDSVKLNLPQILSLEQYCGRHRHPLYGYADIILKGNKLEMSFEHHKELKAILESLGNNRFLCTFSIPVFGINVFPFYTEGQQVKSFTLEVNEFVETTNYQFEKILNP
jgi:CubicO group peptidase (beta-lactamase class C family)